MPRHSIHFESQIETLRKMILALGAIVEESVQKAVRSFKERDAALAMTVIQTDVKVDQMEVELEEECLKTLALYQPVAADLRLIVAILKINNDLERIADLASNIAERTVDLCQQKNFELPATFMEMSEKALWMLKACLDTFVDMNPRLARKVCAIDTDVDTALRAMYREVESVIVKEPDRVHTQTLLLSACRYLERIADLTTNIAEDVVYLVEGKIIRHRSEMLHDENGG